MNIDEESPRRPRKSFRAMFAGVIVTLVAVAALAGAAASQQGPRVTEVLADAAVSTATIGTRVVFTANQPLADVESSQVTIEPETPFTVDTAGRNVGIRFGETLQYDTAYSITVEGVTSAGGGPDSDFTTTVHTPEDAVFLLERSTSGPDRIYRTVPDTSERETFFEQDRIEDYRWSAAGLLVSTSTSEGLSTLTLVRESGETEDVTLPGEGTVSNLQVSESGDRFGYLWSANDRPRIVLGSLTAPGDEPEVLTTEADEPAVATFRLVPRSTAVLWVDANQRLLLADTAVDGPPTFLGNATTIDDTARGSLQALVRTAEGAQSVDLQDGTFTPADTSEDFGTPYSAEEVTSRGILRSYLEFSDEGEVLEQSVVLDRESGEPVVVAEVAPEDALVQVCAAPDGQRVALAIAPDIASNTVDDRVLRIPQEVETHIVTIDTGERVTMPGFAISWCRVPAA